MDSSSQPTSLWRRLRQWRLSPLAFWLTVALIALAGGIAGLGLYTFAYAQGLSYLSDDPNACANCHVMRTELDGWNHGSHKAVATCNDCHTPHTFVAKYAIKGFNGFNHSLHFTLMDFQDPIQIQPRDRSIAYENCLNCHGDMVTAISHVDAADPTDCLKCHPDVGHSR